MKKVSEEVKRFIREYDKNNPTDLLLKSRLFEEVDNAFLVNQIQGRRIASKKFPYLLTLEDYIYPPKTSLEQASSEHTAIFKSSLVSGRSMVDLTGGMGIDLMYMGKDMDTVIYVEPNEALCQLAEHNLQLAGLSVERHYCGTAESFLSENTKLYDVVYLDPSRRISGNKAHDIMELTPNVVDLYPQIAQIAPCIIIKLSPMQHIDRCIELIPSIKDIYCVSLKGEMKEILLKIDTSWTGTTKVHSVILGDPATTYTISYGEAKPVEVGKAKKYIYQPDPAVLKAGMQDYLAYKLSLTKLHPNTHLYTSTEYDSTFPGRIFIAEAETQLNKKQILPYLEGKRAHIVSKNFPLSSDDIRKKLRLQDGGDTYLIAYTNHDNQKRVLVCSRLQ